MERYLVKNCPARDCDDEFFGASAQWALQKIKELNP